MDLNLNLAQEYGFNKQYDLVTDIGVSEHLFDQAMFFKNAHQLTKVGGLMLFVLPFLGYTNHGFVNYQPCLIEDLVCANSYKLMQFYVAERSHLLFDLKSEVWPKTFSSLFTCVMSEGGKGNLLLVAVVRKDYDQEFTLPVQGRYLDDVQTEQLKERYTRQYGKKQNGQPTVLSCSSKPELRNGVGRMRRGIRRSTLSLFGYILRFVLRRI